MSATFITWGIPGIALSLAGVACLWAWWRSRRFTKEYPDRAIADSYRACRDDLHISPIRSESDHRDALGEIERLWGAGVDTPEGDKLDALVTLLAAYEEKHYPIPNSDDPPICSVTGGPMVRGTRPMTITYKDQSITFDMPGWYSGNESVHTGEDMEVSDSALRELKFKANTKKGKP